MYSKLNTMIAKLLFSKTVLNSLRFYTTLAFFYHCSSERPNLKTIALQMTKEGTGLAYSELEIETLR